MWVLPVTRRELVELITPGRRGDVPAAAEDIHATLDLVRPEVMTAVWPVRPTSFDRMPTAIVVSEGTLRDTLAWLSTYLQDYRPVTAFCRVVEKPVAESFLNGPTVPQLQEFAGLFAGLVLGESLAHVNGRISFVDLPATACSATLSYAIARTFALAGRSIPPEDVAQLWSQARKQTGQTELGVSSANILSMWSVVFSRPARSARTKTLFESSDVITRAWAELSMAGEIRSPVWRSLVEGYSGFERLQEIVSMPREYRVPYIDGALGQLAHVRRKTDERSSFLAGYLTSLLAPGTFDHAHMLAPVASVLPTAFLWYGLCTAVNTRGDTLPVGNPLARRIVRDLTLPDRLTDRPRCDVALDEISIHGSASNLLPQTARSGRLDIDLLPGVTMSVRWPPRNTIDETPPRSDSGLELQGLLTEMDETGERYRHLTERIRSLIDLGNAKPVNRRGRRTD